MSATHGPEIIPLIITSAGDRFPTFLSNMFAILNSSPPERLMKPGEEGTESNLNLT